MKRSKDCEDSGDEQSLDDRVSDSAKVKRLHVIANKAEARSPTKRLSLSESQSRKSSPNLSPDLRQDHTRPNLDNGLLEKDAGSPFSSTSSTPSNISVQQPFAPAQTLAADIHYNTLVKAEELISKEGKTTAETLVLPSTTQSVNAETHRSNKVSRKDDRGLDLLGQLLAKVTASKVKNEIDSKHFTTISPEVLDGEIKTILLNSDDWKKDGNSEGMSTRRFKRQNAEISAATSDKMIWISRYVPPTSSSRHYEGQVQSHHGTRLSSSLASGSGGSSSGRETNYESSTVRKKGGGRKLPTSSGRCGKCNTTDTPQWRYIHNGRFCNACYMRVKRWVDSNLGERKLPSRARVDVTPEEDHRLTLEAHYLVNEAFKALEGKC